MIRYVSLIRSVTTYGVGFIDGRHRTDRKYTSLVVLYGDLRLIRFDKSTLDNILFYTLRRKIYISMYLHIFIYTRYMVLFSMVNLYIHTCYDTSVGVCCVTWFECVWVHTMYTDLTWLWIVMCDLIWHEFVCILCDLA